MGYKTEINYILKCSNKIEGVTLNKAIPGEIIRIEKSGLRTYILNAPIMIADHDWNIIGMCIITESTITKESTKLTAKLITKLTKKESIIVSRIIQDAENSKATY